MSVMRTWSWLAGACFLAGVLSCDGPTSDYPSRNLPPQAGPGGGDKSSNDHSETSIDASVANSHKADSGCAAPIEEQPYDDEPSPDGGVDQGDGGLTPQAHSLGSLLLDAGCAP